LIWILVSIQCLALIEIVELSIVFHLLLLTEACHSVNYGQMVCFIVVNTSYNTVSELAHYWLY
jgi:hypothetical protein